MKRFASSIGRIVVSLVRRTNNGDRGRDSTATPNVVPVDERELVTRLIERRRAVRSWWHGEDLPGGAPPVAGIAFSGGGIRSATFSLGVIEALARSPRDALGRIDVMSTVSGGGYIGCFLRSLFMPDQGRGIVPEVAASPPAGERIALDEDKIADQYAFAQKALKSGPGERDLNWPEGSDHKRRNPLWWLREHSRYLAPNGPTDYSYAAAYIARNWVAMQYIFLLGCLALLSILVSLEAWLHHRGWLPALYSWIEVSAASAGNPNCGCVVAPSPALFAPLSPLIWLTLPLLAFAAVLSLAYWLTQRMSPSEPSAGRQWRNLALGTAAALLAALLIALAVRLAGGSIPEGVRDALERAFAGNVELILPAAIVLLLIAAAVVTPVLGFRAGGGARLTSELRRYLTLYLSKVLLWTVFVVTLTLVDSLGAGLAVSIRSLHRLPSGAIGTALLPILAFFIKKLPDWFGGSGKGGLLSLLARFVNAVALLAGVLLYGTVAVIAASLVHLAAWDGAAWQSAPDWSRLMLADSVVLILTLTAGVSSGFINLSSLHLFYASRLTRAYLGGTNNSRLDDAVNYTADSSILENHHGDYIQPELYCRADLPAPIHIINTTINETIDPHSELVARDRKGEMLSLEPAGIRIGDEPFEWADLGSRKCAEQLSLGQWCAISGAAASSGMGRLTNLGFALALTFANVRLGYWWWSPRIRPGDRKYKPKSRYLSFVFGTFVYLFSEMTARYKLGYVRKYLTDGGHFENTGAYRLIGARVPLSIVCDNGSDAKYLFQDLENLIRTVRLDFGYEVEILEGRELEAFLGKLAATRAHPFVDPAKNRDWRSTFRKPETGSFALAMRVRTSDDENEDLHLVWVKPKVTVSAPVDILAYASDNPAFPQQTTADQFFDEAQWESYRKLGDLTMSELLETCPKLLADADWNGAAV